VFSKFVKRHNFTFWKGYIAFILHIDLASSRKIYSEILGGCIRIRELKDSTIEFVKNKYR